MIPRSLARLGLTRAETDAPADDAPAPGVIPPPRQPSIVTPASALGLEGVFRAVQVIVTGASQLTLDVWKDRARLEGDAYPRALARPAEGVCQTDLIAHFVTDLALNGNSYARVIRNPSDGKLAGIVPLPVTTCTPIVTPGGRRYVAHKGKKYKWNEILHLRFLKITGEAAGLGPIQACRRLLSGALDVAAFAADTMRGGGIPTGLLSTDQAITPSQAKETKAQWNESNSARDGVAVLGRGMTYERIGLSPADLQFIETRNFDALAISRLFGVPAHLMSVNLEGNSMTYQNVVDADTTFMRWTVMLYLREIETQLTKILPYAQSTRFNLDAVLRADAATRMKTHETAINAGVYDAAEARRIEGLQ